MSDVGDESRVLHVLDEAGATPEPPSGESAVPQPMPRYPQSVFYAALCNARMKVKFDTAVRQLRREKGMDWRDAKAVAQVLFEQRLEDRGFLNRGIEGGYGIQAPKKQRGVSDIVKEAVSLEDERQLYMEFARRVKKLGRKCTARQAVEWAMENGMLPIQDLDPESCPGLNALSMLWFFKVMPEKLLELWRPLLSKADLEDRARFDDTGENVIGILSPLADGLLDPVADGGDL